MLPDRGTETDRRGTKNYEDPIYSERLSDLESTTIAARPPDIEVRLSLGASARSSRPYYSIIPLF